MIGSVLTATLVEARELKSGRLTGMVNPYVILSIEGQKSQTDRINPSSDPVWNEIISFDIVTGREPIVIQVFDIADIGRDALIGETQIPLETLQDQYKHDEWFMLENPKNAALGGKIRINLHWIHSRRKFLEDILKIQDLAIEEDKQEKAMLEAQLANMKKPFGFIQAYYFQE